MRKWVVALLLGCTFCVGSNVAMAADYWVYSDRGYNFYVITETQKSVKGAYQIKIKETLPSGKVDVFGYEVYHNGKGIVYSSVPNRSGQHRMSNGHDLAAAVWKYVTTHK